MSKIIATSKCEYKKLLAGHSISHRSVGYNINNYDPEPTENGMIVGGNGIRYRPSTETHAPGIEIPANNGKPAEAASLS